MDNCFVLLLQWLGIIWICSCCTIIHIVLDSWIHLRIILGTIRRQSFGHGLHNERIDRKSPFTETNGSLCWLSSVYTRSLYSFEKSRPTLVLGHNGRNLHLVLHLVPLHNQGSTKLEGDQKGRQEAS